MMEEPKIKHNSKSQVFQVPGKSSHYHQKTATLPEAAVLLLNEILSNNNLQQQHDKAAKVKHSPEKGGIKSVGQTPRIDNKHLKESC